MHKDKPIFTAQFHPEAFGGPTDTEVTFVSFLTNVSRISPEYLLTGLNFFVIVSV